MKKVLLKSMLLFAAILFMGTSYAQTVSGTVTEENGPLPGANVVVKGTSNGATTDFDGKYTLNNVASDAVLVFSYVGYSTQEVAVGGRSTINVAMTADNALEEVVLIGYGTQSVKDATGAVAVVSSEDFNGGVIASPEQLIQGKTAGVQITQTSGEPGAGIALSIRGTSGIRANNNPLFVVDGVPLGGGATAGGGADVGFGSSASRNPLNFINPNDIESISILKDASATAIYGSRGANGVVIIQTKNGRGNSRGVFELNSTLSISTPAEQYDLLNRSEYLGAITQFGGVASERDFGTNTDWQDVVTRTAASRNTVLSYSKSYNQGNVRASLGYGNQFGVVEKSSLERLTGRLNLQHRLLDDKLKLGLQATLSRVNDEAPSISDNAGFQGDLLGAAYSANPTWPDDVNFVPGGSDLNPRQLLEYFQSETETDRFLGNFSAEYAITPELSAKVNVGYDKSESFRGTALSGQISGFNNGVQNNGRGAITELELENSLLNATLNYEKEFSNSKFSALAGFEYQKFQASGRNLSGFGFGTTNLDGIVGRLESSADLIESNITGSFQQYGLSPNGGLFVNRLFPEVTTDQLQGNINTSVRSVVGNFFDNEDELQSYFVRANYSIADKYLFTATMRADGSSRFGENERYGYFPSGAFAWKIDEEDFIGDNVSTLKLRIGYGITGSQDGLGHNNYTRRRAFGGAGISQDGTINVPGTFQVAFSNPDLRWEETSQANFGIDFGFNNDRLNGSIDVYYKDTSGFLLTQFSAQPAPQPFVFGNVDGNIINQGIEVSLNYDVIDSEDTSWNVGFNVAYNENEIQNFGGQIPFGQIFGQGLTGAFAQLLAEDRPLFSYYLREFQGYDENGQQIGDIQQFVDKSALPDVNLGISTSFRHKNWDASLFFAGQYGHYIYNNTANAFFTAGSIANGRNVINSVLTSGEAGNNAPDVSTRFLEKGDFLRLQNATIGYNWDLSGEGVFKTLRMYVNGQNLFVITDYTGLDPEVNVSNSQNTIPSRGIDYTSFPRPRTYTLGVNATF